MVIVLQGVGLERNGFDGKCVEGCGNGTECDGW
jgi:hypothetical protein